jgi:hypothetical protein
VQPKHEERLTLPPGWVAVFSVASLSQKNRPDIPLFVSGQSVTKKERKSVTKKARRAQTKDERGERAAVSTLPAPPCPLVACLELLLFSPTSSVLVWTFECEHTDTKVAPPDTHRYQAWYTAFRKRPVRHKERLGPRPRTSRPRRPGGPPHTRASSSFSRLLGLVAVSGPGSWRSAAFLSSLVADWPLGRLGLEVCLFVCL